MAKKDKFQQLKEGGGALSSFQDMVEQASTVAAIAQQAEEKPPVRAEGEAVAQQPRESTLEKRMTHLPNPAITVRDYNLATQYCYQHDNMTRLDWMELAIIEKLHNDGLIPDDEFAARREEIRKRPPRGMRKNTKAQINR